MALGFGFGFPRTLRAGSWTPAQISTAMWIDAADTSTITLNGSTVSQWSDKSGNARHMVQATAALQPSYGATSFSLASVNFGDDFMTSAAISGAASDWAIYGVNKQTETSPSSNDSIVSSNATGAGMFQVSSSVTTLTVSANADGTSTFFSLSVDPSNAPNYRLLGLETSTASGTASYLNGAVAATNAATIRNTATVGFKLNVNRAGGLYLQSDHAEWIVLPSVPATAVRQQIEGYLAWKWGGIPQTRAWTPADLGADLTMWLDADDASTITLNGSTVSQWSDKSASGAHVAQATASSQPLYTPSGLNGKSVITFSGAQRLNSVLEVLLGGTVAAVSQRSASTQPVFEVSPTSSRGYQGSANGFQTHNAYRANGGTATTVVFPTAISGAPAISVATDRRTTTAISHSIGHGSPGFVPLTGYISEIVSTETILSTDNRQKLEGYLAHKWGLTANLPADHPYKSAAPTVAI